MNTISPKTHFSSIKSPKWICALIIKKDCYLEQKDKIIISQTNSMKNYYNKENGEDQNDHSKALKNKSRIHQVLDRKMIQL